MVITGNSIYAPSIQSGGGLPVLADFTYTGNWRWYDTEHTVIALESSGAITFNNDFLADAFLVGAGGAGAGYYSVLSAAYAHLATNYYGDYVAIVAGNSAEYGEDIGELVIADAIVLEVLA